MGSSGSCVYKPAYCVQFNSLSPGSENALDEIQEHQVHRFISFWVGV